MNKESEDEILSQYNAAVREWKPGQSLMADERVQRYMGHDPEKVGEVEQTERLLRTRQRIESEKQRIHSEKEILSEYDAALREWKPGQSLLADKRIRRYMGHDPERIGAVKELDAILKVTGGFSFKKDDAERSR